MKHSSYQLTPTFRRDTIRKYASNASEMKKMAAWDFEDLLQVGVFILLTHFQ
jgi:hypothetical protein